MQVKPTQPQTPAQIPAQTIPAHVLERMENEWRQMRQGAGQPSSR
ncbi:hypothetical protein [Ciceribacter azotifigens]